MLYHYPNYLITISDSSVVSPFHPPTTFPLSALRKAAKIATKVLPWSAGFRNPTFFQVRPLFMWKDREIIYHFFGGEVYLEIWLLMFCWTKEKLQSHRFRQWKKSGQTIVNYFGWPWEILGKS
jgi:hypothetical protein